MIRPNQVTLRFDSKRQIEEVRRAAKRADMSLNKYAIRVLERQAKADIQPPAIPQDSVA